MSDKLLTQDELDEIEARANAATPGPWIACPDHDKNHVELDYDAGHDEYVAYLSGQGEGPGALFQAPRNAEFIAHARQDVPRLVKRIRELEARLDEAEKVTQ